MGERRRKGRRQPRRRATGQVGHVSRDGRRAPNNASARLEAPRPELVLESLGELLHEHSSVRVLGQPKNERRQDLDDLVAVARAVPQRVEEGLGQAQEREPGDRFRSTVHPLDDTLCEARLHSQLCGHGSRRAGELYGIVSVSSQPAVLDRTGTDLVHRLDERFKDGATGAAEYSGQCLDRSRFKQDRLDAGRLFLQPVMPGSRRDQLSKYLKARS